MQTTYLEQVAPYRVAIADLSRSEGYWVIHRINVPQEYRRRGVGTTLLHRILHDADASRTTLALHPFGSGGMRTTQLASWYRRHGFTPGPDGYFMLRPPATPRTTK